MKRRTSHGEGHWILVEVQRFPAAKGALRIKPKYGEKVNLPSFAPFTMRAGFKVIPNPACHPWLLSGTISSADFLGGSCSNEKLV
jgi:hypothetical protein